MKLLNLQLLFTLCLTLINALNVNDIPVTGDDINGIFILDEGPFAPRVYVDTCAYNQSRKRVYCTFKDKKYNDDKLYISIPIEKNEGEFKNDTEIKEWSLIDCYSGEKTGCFTTDVLGYTSLWEKVEAGDTYGAFDIAAELWNIFEDKFFSAELKNGSSINLHYKKMYIAKLG